MFCKKGVLKYFANFTAKLQCQSLFFDKAAVHSLQLSGAFLFFCFKNTFFIEHLWRLLLTVLTEKLFLSIMLFMMAHCDFLQSEGRTKKSLFLFPRHRYIYNCNSFLRQCFLYFLIFVRLFYTPKLS